MSYGNTSDNNHSILWTELDLSRARLAPRYESSGYPHGFWRVVDGFQYDERLRCLQACGRLQTTSSTTETEHVSKYRYDPEMPRNTRESWAIAQKVLLPGKDLRFVLRPSVAVRFGHFYWRRRISPPLRVS